MSVGLRQDGTKGDFLGGSRGGEAGLTGFRAGEECGEGEVAMMNGVDSSMG